MYCIMSALPLSSYINMHLQSISQSEHVCCHLFTFGYLAVWSATLNSTPSVIFRRINRFSWHPGSKIWLGIIYFVSAFWNDFCLLVQEVLFFLLLNYRKTLYIYIYIYIYIYTYIHVTFPPGRGYLLHSRMCHSHTVLYVPLSLMKHVLSKKKITCNHILLPGAI